MPLSLFGRLALFATVCGLAGIAVGWGGSLNETQQKRVTGLEGKLLAPCCYQEPVGRHQSEVAVRMRLEIARLVEEGRTDSEIVQTYVQRYGQKVVADFAPTPGWAQYLPWLLTVTCGAGLAWWIRRMVRAHAVSQA